MLLGKILWDTMNFSSILKPTDADAIVHKRTALDNGFYREPGPNKIGWTCEAGSCTAEGDHWPDPGRWGQVPWQVLRPVDCLGDQNKGEPHRFWEDLE